MRSLGKFALGLFTLTALSVASIEPAEAKRRGGIRFGAIGFGGSGSSSVSYEEKIDKVQDLPNSETYFHDGKYYDLGSFYTVRGGKARYPEKPSFVLYNGDSFVRLSEAEVKMMSEDVGLDLTSNYLAQYKIAHPKNPNEIERREGESAEALRARARGIAGSSARSSETVAAASGGSGGFGGFLLPGLVIGGMFVFGGRKFMRKRIAAAIHAPVGEEAPADTGSFENRLAQRLRELEVTPPGDLRGAPAPRTFGRKLA